VVVGLLWIAPWYAVELAGGARLRLDAVTAGSLAYVGLMASVVAYLAWNEGVAAHGPQRSAPYLHLLPVFASILAAVLLDEGFHGYHAAGFGLVLAGLRVAGGKH